MKWSLLPWKMSKRDQLLAKSSKFACNLMRMIIIVISIIVYSVHFSRSMNIFALIIIMIGWIFNTTFVTLALTTTCESKCKVLAEEEENT